MAVPDTTEKSSSFLGVYFYAVLLALFGALLGFIYMVTFPAQSFESQAKYEASLADDADSEEPVYSKPGDAYYIEGPILRTRSWEAKRRQLTTEGAQSVSLSAGEINGWMAAKFRVMDAPKGDEDSGVLIKPGVPNVGLLDGEGMFVNVPVTVSAYGAEGEYVVSLFGNIKPSGLKIESMKISSAKLPLPSIIGKQVLNVLSEGYKSTEEYKIVSEAFDRVQSASIKDGQLVIALR